MPVWVKRMFTGKKGFTILRCRPERSSRDSFRVGTAIWQVIWLVGIGVARFGMQMCSLLRSPVLFNVGTPVQCSMVSKALRRLEVKAM